jgi:hypothetical protein|tara:strand:+ start:4286 stop:7144 length:2859 start_codon:yes stop_codon:yes gene_type:complete
MITKKFLSRVLGDNGNYCVFAARSRDKRREQNFYDTVDEVDTAAQELDAAGYDVYFALATFKTTENRKAYNAHQLRSIFLDLDCGPSKEYSSQAEAIADLRKFCKRYSLPKPMMVNSGRGVHVYWFLTEALSVDDWLPIAERFKEICSSSGLKADPVVTADAARVLRVPSTHNYKDTPPSPVEMYGADIPEPVILSEFMALFGETVKPELSPHPSRETDAVREAKESNKEFIFKDIIDKTRQGRGCAQIMSALTSKNDVSEPTWRGVLSVLQACTDGSREKAHKISKGYEGYSEDETDKKWDYIEGKAVELGVRDISYKCATFAGINNNLCTECPNWGKVKSPKYLGERLKEALADIEPEDDPFVAGRPSRNIIPPYPFPYVRGAHGGVYVRRKNEDGDTEEACIYHNDMYVTRILHDASLGGYVVVFRLHLPKDGVREFTMPMSSISSKEEFRKAVAINGVTSWGKNLEELMAYTTKWIDELQAAAASDEAHLQFGWTNSEAEAFVLGDRLILGNSIEYNPPSKKTAGLFSAFEPKGSEARQLEMFEFYNRDRFQLHQFVIGTGFGSILMPFTGQNSMGLHLFGGSGVGKTTAMRAALGIYGGPEVLMNHHSDTHNSRMNRCELMRNLPMSSDEMTNITPEWASKYVYELSGGMQKNRMSSDGNTERYRGEPWELIGVTSANVSLWELLNRKKATPLAEMLRMLEIKVDKSLKDPSLKPITDKIFADIKSNYGWLGPKFIQYIINNRDEVALMVTKVRDRIDKAAALEPEHRFWSAGCAATLTGIIIAKKIGLVNWDIPELFKWVIAQVRVRKNMVDDVGSSVIETLNDYVFANNNNILQIRSTADLRQGVNGNGLDYASVVPEATPRNHFIARYEIDTQKLYLLPKPLKQYCTDHQLSYDSLVQDMTTGMGAKKVQMRLGKGTHLNLPPSRCIVVDYSEGIPDEPQSSED